MEKIETHIIDINDPKAKEKYFLGQVSDMIRINAANSSSKVLFDIKTRNIKSKKQERTL